MKIGNSSGLPLWAKRLIFTVRIMALAAAILMGIHMVSLMFYAPDFYSRSPIFWSLMLTAVRLCESLIFAFLSLGLAQLLAYLLDDSRQLGWLLRYAHFGLIAWAGLGLISIIMSICFQLSVQDKVALSSLAQYWWILLASITWLAQALILVVIALVLRRVLPIIEESRAVV